MSNLRALLFDVDGTLADTERDGHRVAFNLAFQEAGLPWDWTIELYGKLLAVAGGKERIRHYIKTYNPPFDQPSNLDEFIAGLHKAKTKFYTQLLSEGQIPLRPGIRRILDEARTDGIRLAIVTTTTPQNVTALLDSTLPAGGPLWFEVIAAGDIVPAKKPAADIYYYTLHEMKLSAKECLAFEDSYNGVISSVTAGVPTVITVTDYTQHQDFSGAAVVLNHLGDPGDPCRILSGAVDPFEYFTLDTAHQLYTQVWH